MASRASKDDHGAKGPKPRTKVEISNLPPGLTEEQFRAAVSQIKNIEDCVEYFYFMAGKSSPTKRVKSFCVISFKNPQDLFEFAQKFNGHMFVDSRGVEYAALVQYAPFQRVPKPRKKPDARQGTILEDEDYIKFVEALSAPVGTLPSAEAQLEKRLTEEKELIDLNGGRAPPIMSPLLQAMLDKKKMRAQKKIAREERRKGERRKKRKEGAKEKNADGKTTAGAGEKRERTRKRGVERKERKAAKGEGELDAAQQKPKRERRRKTPATEQKGWVAIQKQLEPGEVRIAVREKPLSTPATASSTTTIAAVPKPRNVPGRLSFLRRVTRSSAPGIIIAQPPLNSLVEGSPRKLDQITPNRAALISHSLRVSGCACVLVFYILA